MERISLVDDSRQAGMLQSLHFNPLDTHVIIGCGGIGFWLGLMITMIGATELVIMDGDKIDNSNLSRLPVPQTWIGQNKAVALRKMIRMLRPDVRVVCFTTHITPDTIDLLKQFSQETIKKRKHQHPYVDPKMTVWDTTDDAKIQHKINDYVKELRKSKTTKDVIYRKIGYEGFAIGSYADFSVWTQEDYTTGYRTTNANAVSSALAAGMGFLARYLVPMEDVEVNLSSLIREKAKCTTSKEKTKKAVKKKPSMSGTRALSVS
jgi:hypothetical protein